MPILGSANRGFMNISPFESIEDMAKWSFFTIDELKTMACHTDDYSVRMFANVVESCVKRKEFSDGVMIAEHHNQAADIGKEWSTASRMDRGATPYITYGAKSEKRAKMI